MPASILYPGTVKNEISFLQILDGNGTVLHTQDSSYLESGESYDKDKVVRFFNNWKPSAIVQ